MFETFTSGDWGEIRGAFLDALRDVYEKQGLEGARLLRDRFFEAMGGFAPRNTDLAVRAFDEVYAEFLEETGRMN
jgi:hypothetical protein